MITLETFLISLGLVLELIIIMKVTKMDKSLREYKNTRNGTRQNLR